MSRHRSLSELAGLDQLPSPKRDRVRAHLADCQRCRDELTFARETRVLLRAVTTPVVAPETLDRILARRRAGERVILPADVPRERPRRRLAVPIAVAATLVATVAIAAELLRRPADPSLTEPEPPAAEASAPVGVAIVPTGREVEVRILGTGRLRIEATLHDGRELGVRGRGAAESARFRATSAGITVSEVTGGTLEVRIPRGLTGRLYLSDRLEITTDGNALRAERSGESGERLVLELLR
ncbi:MAG: hypothetical protein R2909_04360 [Gemmatimonadales bacterium]